MERIRKLFFSKEFICFVIIGCINTLSGAGFSAIYSIVLDEMTAFALGYATGILVSYSLNTTFTFKQKPSLNKLIKFAISTIPNFLIQITTVYIIVTLLGLHKLIAYGLAAIIGVPVTFVILKIIVFIKEV